MSLKVYEIHLAQNISLMSQKLIQFSDLSEF